MSVFEIGKYKKERDCWSGMKSRCNNPKDTCYANYGGRGIKVCDRWNESFRNFFEDMGEAPSKIHTIERIEVNLGYSKDNCRWATMEEQANNKRNNRMLTFNGVTKSMAMWAKDLDMSYFLLRKRLYDGWTMEQAVNSPSGTRIKVGSVPTKNTRTPTSQYIGVYLDRREQKWGAVLSRKSFGGRHHIGTYNTELEAAMAFIAFYKKKFGVEPYSLPDSLLPLKAKPDTNAPVKSIPKPKADTTKH